jgi:hypothetical protein
VRKRKTVRLHNLRRLYQLFTFMEIPAESRIELVSALFTKLRLEPEPLPYFGDENVRRSLVQEAVVFAGKSPDAAVINYIGRLATHFGIEPNQTAKWTVTFRHRVMNQHGEEVMECTVKRMLRGRNFKN